MTMQPAKIDSMPMPIHRASPSFQDVAVSAANVHLRREDIGGRFSTIDSGPFVIRTEEGMVLSVRAGSVRAVQSTNDDERLLWQGDRLVAERSGLLTVRSHVRTELQIDWPMPGSEEFSEVGRNN